MANLLSTLRVLKLSDFYITTWLLMGAVAQSTLLCILPNYIAWVPAVLVLCYRIIYVFLVNRGLICNKSLEGVTIGVSVAQYPDSKGEWNGKRSAEDIVVMILTAQWNHPGGKLSPGSKQLGAYFAEMWQDADTNRKHYGYLGRTPPLVTEPDTSPGHGSKYPPRTVVTLSYWRTLAGLQSFAHNEAHRKGWQWWDKGANKKFTHIGISHEVYEAKKGSWENIHHNSEPIGFGAAKFPVDGDAGNFVSGFRHVDEREWASMVTRMGREAGSLANVDDYSQ